MTPYNEHPMYFELSDVEKAFVNNLAQTRDWQEAAKRTWPKSQRGKQTDFKRDMMSRPDVYMVGRMALGLPNEFTKEELITIMVCRLKKTKAEKHFNDLVARIVALTGWGRARKEEATVQEISLDEFPDPIQ